MATPSSLHLLVVTHVEHAQVNGRMVAYAPYARELTEWCKLFGRVTIAAPMAACATGGDCEVIDASNVALRPIRVPSGGGWYGRLVRLLYAPMALMQLAIAGRGADALHVRAPGYLGLIAIVLSPLLASRRIAKYAGQWGRYDKEPIASRLQRQLLRSRWWGAPVLAYTSGYGEPTNVVPFFSSALTEEQMSRARAAAGKRGHRKPRRLLFVGRLSPAKHVDVLLKVIASLRREGNDVSCTVVGEGPERAALEDLAHALGIASAVRFDGGVTVEEVLARYEEADLLVLPSETEGWPKVVVEAMAFGLLVIGPERGVVPWIVAHGGGWVVPPADQGALARALRACLQLTEAEVEGRRAAGAAWASRYTVEAFARGLSDVITATWGAPVRATGGVAANG